MSGPAVNPREFARLSKDIVDSTVEASRALFAAREQQSTVLLRRAASAYGEANGLDRAVTGPSKRVNI